MGLGFRIQLVVENFHEWREFRFSTYWNEQCNREC